MRFSLVIFYWRRRVFRKGLLHVQTVVVSNECERERARGRVITVATFVFCVVRFMIFDSLMMLHVAGAHKHFGRRSHISLARPPLITKRETREEEKKRRRCKQTNITLNRGYFHSLNVSSHFLGSLPLLSRFFRKIYAILNCVGTVIKQ